MKGALDEDMQLLAKMIEKLRGKEDKHMDQMQKEAQDAEKNRAHEVGSEVQTENAPHCDATDNTANTNGNEDVTADAGAKEEGGHMEDENVTAEEITEEDTGSLQQSELTLQESVDAPSIHESWPCTPVPEHRVHSDKGSEASSQRDQTMNMYRDTLTDTAAAQRRAPSTQGSETSSQRDKSMHTTRDAVPHTATPQHRAYSAKESSTASQPEKASYRRHPPQQRRTHEPAPEQNHRYDERSYGSHSDRYYDRNSDRNSDRYFDSYPDSHDYDAHSEGTTAEASERGSKRTTTSRRSADGQLLIHTDVERGVAPAYRSSPPRTLTHDEILLRMTDDHPDVLLDIPNVSVDEISLEVNRVHANVSLDARVANLVQLTAGVDASIDRVNLSIKGVRAQALLVVRLNNVRGIVEKTVSSIVENPLLLETVSGIANNVLRPGGIVSETVHTLGDTIVQTVDRAGNIVEKVVTQPMQPAPGAVADRAGSDP